MTMSLGGCEIFVDTWVEEVRRLVPQVKALRQSYEDDRRAVEYGEDWSPTEHDLYEGGCRLWAAQHHLVWAAHQVERWTRRLAAEQGETPPDSDPVLADLRNALEHLDEALIDDVGATAMAGDNPKINRSLRRLPGAQLRIDVSGSLLFELIGSSDIERRARAVATTADRLMQEAEDRAVEYGRPDTPDDEQGGDYD